MTHMQPDSGSQTSLPGFRNVCQVRAAREELLAGIKLEQLPHQGFVRPEVR